MLIMSIISSPDVANADVAYQGKVSYFNANFSSSLINAAQASKIPEHYCACRWKISNLCRNLNVKNKDLRETLFRSYRVEVMNPRNGRKIEVVPVDTGPARWTGRAIDLDKGTLEALELKTDDKAIFKLVRRGQ